MNWEERLRKLQVWNRDIDIRTNRRYIIELEERIEQLEDAVRFLQFPTSEDE